MKLRYKIILVLIACIASFFLGRLTIKDKEIVKYVKGETVVKTIEVPKYIYETIPSKPVFKTKTDTLYVNEKEVIVQTVDTQAIIRDYIAEREYRFNVFDNEYGKMDIDQTIQYNELRRFDYSFTPNQKVITKETKKIIVPFVSASYNTFNTIGIGGGIFYHNIGIEYQYMRDVKYGIDGHGVGIKVKF